MEDRRSLERLQVDVHLDDLQSEMEVGARALERIHGAATGLDDRVRAHLDHAAAVGTLLRQIGGLRRCVEVQRARLSELRDEMRKLRSHARRAARTR